MTSGSHLDPESKRLQDQVDQLVRTYSGEDVREYWRRWKQIGSWAYNRTEGDAVKKAKLKKRLYEENEGKCQRCGDSFDPGALTMHRVDTSLNWDRSKGFGYTHDNVRLLCNICHQAVEEAMRLGPDSDH